MPTATRHRPKCPPRPDELWVPPHKDSRPKPPPNVTEGPPTDPPASSLVTRETSEHPWDARTAQDAKANSRRQHQLRLIAAEKTAEGQTHAAAQYIRTATALDECSKYAWACHGRDTGTPYLAINRCRQRLCPHCQRARALQICHKIYPTVRDFTNRHFITLTQKHDSRPLWLQIASIRAAWKKLRRTKLWQQKCKGGFYTIEITMNRKTRRWHPHIHMVADCYPIDQAKLSDEWRRITGNSFIVDIRQMTDGAAAVRELAKYINKPGEPLRLTLPELEDYVDALKDCRLIQAWGTCHNNPPDPEAHDEPEKKERIVMLHIIKHAAAEGDDVAAALYKNWLEIPNTKPDDQPQNLGQLTLDWYRTWQHNLAHGPPRR